MIFNSLKGWFRARIPFLWSNTFYFSPKTAKKAFFFSSPSLKDQIVDENVPIEKPALIFVPPQPTRPSCSSARLLQYLFSHRLFQMSSELRSKTSVRQRERETERGRENEREREREIEIDREREREIERDKEIERERER